MLLLSIRLRRPPRTGATAPWHTRAMPRRAALLIWLLLAAGCGAPRSPHPEPPATRPDPAPAGAVDRPRVPGIDESGDRALAGSAPGLGPALDRYHRGDYAGAAMAFADRLDDHDAAATFFFAKSIYHLGYPTASVHWFSQCVTAGHPFRTRALHWLTTFTTAEPLAEILLGGPEVAAIAAASEWSSRALYFLATAETPLERTDAARTHFELIASSRGGDADQERIRDLARLQPPAP